jgi:hypothetical protein
MGMMVARGRSLARRKLQNTKPAASPKIVYGTASRKMMLQVKARVAGSFGEKELPHIAHDWASADAGPHRSAPPAIIADRMCPSRRIA